MAPAPNYLKGRATSYGAIHLGGDAGASEPDDASRGKLLVAKSFLVFALCAVSVASFMSGAGVAEESLVEVVDSSVNAGDDSVKVAADCWCDKACVTPGSYVDHVTGKTVMTPYGTCSVNKSIKFYAKKATPKGEVVDLTKGRCMGVDYQLAIPNAAGDMMAACEETSGAYDCSGFPCQNHGFCIDGVEAYTCVCPFGYDGVHCETDVNECAQQVCDENAECENTVGAYLCTCKAGFMGDGYQYDQVNVPHGSVEIPENGGYRHGWLDRTEVGQTDQNEDGLHDGWGCTDINDCSSSPCFNGGRCIDLWDGAYQDMEAAWITVGDGGTYCDGNIEEEYADYTEEQCERKCTEHYKCNRIYTETAAGGGQRDAGLDQVTADAEAAAEAAAIQKSLDETSQTNAETAKADADAAVVAKQAEVDAMQALLDERTAAFLPTAEQEDGLATLTAELGEMTTTQTNADATLAAAVAAAEASLANAEATATALTDAQAAGDAAAAALAADSAVGVCRLYGPEATCPAGVDASKPLGRVLETFRGELMNVLNGEADEGYAYSVDPQSDLFKAQGKPNEWECDCSVMLPMQRFEGDQCEEDIDECATGENNCDVPESTQCDNTEGSFSCTCKAYWQGDAYAPDSDPETWGCTNKASSVPGQKSKGSCQYADTGYIGCEDINDCLVVTPLGVDADSDGNEDVLVESPCKNGGTCDNDNMGTDNYLCTCVDGWLDDQNCETDRNECEVWDNLEQHCDTNAHCHNIPGSWMCLCNNGWTGNGELQGGCYDADDCEFSPCQHGGTCTDCGTLCLICDCVVGWRGKTCEIDWNECKMGIHTCHDMAICINVPGSFECECEPGFSGDGYRLCNAIDDCVRWEDDLTVDDATTTDYGEKRYDTAGRVIEEENIITPAPWADDMPIIVYSDCDYDADAASRGAVRELGLSALDAQNLAKNSVKCKKVKDPIDVHQCGEWEKATRTWINHGACEDIGPASFVCTCDPGWSDSNCDLDIDECARSTDLCHKYGTCINIPGSYYCECNFGYTGDGETTCHDVDDCSYGPERCYAGRCTDLGAGDFRCVCVEGYMDRLCDRDINECADFTHTCTPEKFEDGEVTPGAICTNMPGSYKCMCRDGFDGDGIGAEGCDDVDECGSSPCENGECIDNGQLSYQCVCDYGWVNKHCDFDYNECYTGNHDCHPEGKCVNTPGGYYCRCVSGHTGDGYTCTDLDDCDPDPCDPEHGTCEDGGANKYVCHCDPGFAGMGCEQDEVECMIGTHECHANADCFNTYGSYICVCKDEFYGDGVVCAPCIDCYADCADNEFFGLCPGHEDYHGPLDYSKILDMPEFCPTAFSCGHGPGYENDDTMPPCAAVDRTCIQINECFRSTDDCDPMWSDCDDTEGSFLCECQIYEEKWGTGRKDECWDCTVCEAGKRMLDECTATTDRTCRMTVYDGNYAMETQSGSVNQCLVHWKEAGKIFPERYAWGGRLGTPMGEEHGGYGSQSVGKYEMWGGGETGEDIKDIIPSPDVCAGGEEPICGVCNYGDLSPGENIVKGMEAAWTFMHLELDLYLIMNAADGNGFRCLGFQTANAPYPSLLTWHFTTVTEDEGSCMTIVNEGFANETLALVLPEQACVEDAECKGRAGRDICERQTMEAGEWMTNGRGPDDMSGITKCNLQEDGTMRDSLKNRDDCELVYFCGFETNEAGTAREKLMANGGTVWNVFPLACTGTPDRPAQVERSGATHIGNFCEKRWTAEKYIIRSLATGDENEDGVVDYADYRCLYFPDTVGGIPEMTPAAASPDGIWLGAGGDADVDADGDKDCGISLLGFETAEEMNAALKMHGSSDMSLTQEKALIINKQAVIRLIRLPNF